MTDLTARAHVLVDASPEQVWETITSPELTPFWMGGARVSSDWKPGSLVTWSGVVGGHPFADSGTVLEVDAPRRLITTHRSGGLSRADVPEDPHVVTDDIVAEDGATLVSVTQVGDQRARAIPEYEKAWAQMLHALKDVVEHGPGAAQA